MLARLRAVIRRAWPGGDGHPDRRRGDRHRDADRRPSTTQRSPDGPRYALVELLGCSAASWSPRTMIYDRLFGDDDDTLSNVVDVPVSHIRKKLGRDLIVTRRGEGYIIDG